MHKIIVRAFLKVLPRRYFGNVAFKRKRGRVFIVMRGSSYYCMPLQSTKVYILKLLIKLQPSKIV